MGIFNLMQLKTFLANKFYYLLGITFLLLSKVKNILHGYSTPKPFSISKTAKCIEYDMSVVDQWISHLQNYSHNSFSIAGKNILELGPGSDLGIGLYLLAKGCSQYNACDANNLMKSTPDHFYDQLFNKFKSMNIQTDFNFLKRQLTETKNGKPSLLNYIVRNDFNFAAAIKESTIELVVSQAAFEHFENMESVISQLNFVCKPGAMMVLEIDLKTHSRWISNKDPNNIFRYSSSLYNAFKYRGIPNRMRPYQYKELFEKYGWENIVITPIELVKNRNSAYSGLDKAFFDNSNQMEFLSIIFCARKK
jgi:hypothetical protein